MFKIEDDGSVLIKNDAILGDTGSNGKDIKKACHALTAQKLVARFQKEAVLRYREQQSTLHTTKEQQRRYAIAEAAKKSQATSLEELEEEIGAQILSNQLN